MTSEAITELLRRWNQGDRDGLDGVISAMLPQLRRIAHRIASRNGGNTLETTALANELYLRFAQSCPGAQNRQHMLALAATTMQHVLVDHSRRHMRQKRGSGAVHVDAESAPVLTDDQLERVVLIDEALRSLEQHDARQALVFRTRFFGGFTVAEVAESLAVSENTVIRDWSSACAFLRALIGSGRGEL